MRQLCKERSQEICGTMGHGVLRAWLVLGEVLELGDGDGR